jgi:site-specific DNA-methyltransferase (adenine-specific)
MTVTLHHGDCLDVVRTMPADSVDSIVTDPPYGLSFMGKHWDYALPGIEIWAECLRVVKPGGHLLAFAGTRTQHRMAVHIEDAGFEIRDMIAWVYASGFPKSHNLKGEWQGWGTALKPALEPITVARKPLIGTVAENVLAHGTGALNVDGCRIELNGDYKCRANGRPSQTGLPDNYDPQKANQPDTTGRWPANLIHDGSEEVLAGFPVTTSGAMKRTVEGYDGDSHTGFLRGRSGPHNQHGDTGSAARFFYCAKASKKDRGDENNHPTVKPTDLMRYLCRLVTPTGGIVLDPFMGSGSTGKAAVLEGFSFIGIEREAEYFNIAKARLAAAKMSLSDTPPLFAGLSI